VFENRSYLCEFKEALARESGAQGVLFDESDHHHIHSGISMWAMPPISWLSCPPHRHVCSSYLQTNNRKEEAISRICIYVFSMQFYLYFYLWAIIQLCQIMYVLSYSSIVEGSFIKFVQHMFLCLLIMYSIVHWKSYYIPVSNLPLAWPEAFNRLWWWYFCALLINL
jgi:hypothetical protein